MVLAGRVLASAAVLFAGFRAVSDDDFARVVIAERWAAAPRWDASGTSWLPAPFWITGAAMTAFGATLDVARVVAALLGLGAAVLVYLAARWLGEAPRGAALGATFASFSLWGARLGVATVPELAAAALALLAVGSLATLDGRRRLAGALALLLATLSRYEAWPVAAAFAALTMVDARRADSGSRRPLVAAAATALAGPLAWMVSNHVAHGEALHFLTRVAAYRQALGPDDASGLARFLAYPRAFVTESKEVMVLLAAGAALAFRGRASTVAPRGYVRPAAIAAFQIVALSLARVRDGAPTHHPERATLTVALLACVFAGGSVTRVADRRVRSSLALALAGGALAFTLTRSPGDLARRRDEEAIGRAAAARVGPRDRVLVEVRDYGFLATEAALGHPERAEEDRSIDPRDPFIPSSFTAEAGLAQRIRRDAPAFVIAAPSPVTRAVLGAPILEQGALALFAVNAP